MNRITPLPAIDQSVHPMWQAAVDEIRNIDIEAAIDHPVVQWFMLETFIPPSELLNLAMEEDREIASRTMAVLDDPGRPGLHINRHQLVQAKSISQIYWLARINNYLSLPTQHVLEIGGGVGNLARIFSALELCETYHIVDIDEVCDLQEKFLETCLTRAEYARIRLHRIGDTDELRDLSQLRFDLAISTFAFTEAPAEIQSWYAHELLAKTHSVYIVGQRNFMGNQCIDLLENTLNPSHSIQIAPSAWETHFGAPSFELIASGL